MSEVPQTRPVATPQVAELHQENQPANATVALGCVVAPNTAARVYWGATVEVELYGRLAEMNAPPEWRDYHASNIELILNGAESAGNAGMRVRLYDEERVVLALWGAVMSGEISAGEFIEIYSNAGDAVKAAGLAFAQKRARSNAIAIALSALPALRLFPQSAVASNPTAGVARSALGKRYEEGSHTIFRRNGTTGRVNHYETRIPQTNPRNPNPWQREKRYDGEGPPHFNKHQDSYVPTPHVHDPEIPGGVRPADPTEIPGGG